MAATQQDAINAVSAVATDVTTAATTASALETDVTAFIAAHPAADYQPIIDALTPVATAAAALNTSIANIDAQIKAAP